MFEGRVLYNGTTFNREFIITDQQGNARVSFQNNGSGTAVVKQETSYYGFGMQLANGPVTPPTVPNKQLYNGGSEWQNDYPTGTLPDYQQTFYRNYDAALGRFIGVDPAAESAESLTSYQYAGNNPILFNDPMGDLLPLPGSKTPPAYQNVGGGSNLPADIQASVDAFYASTSNTGDGLYYSNQMAYWDAYNSGVITGAGVSIFHAGDGTANDPSTGNLAVGIAAINAAVTGGGINIHLYADGQVMADRQNTPGISVSTQRQDNGWDWRPLGEGGSRIGSQGEMPQ